MSAFQCSDRIPQIQYALQSLPEYNNIYTIDVTATTNIPNPSASGVDAIPQCDVDFRYSSSVTGYAQRDRRRVTFSRDPESDEYIVSAVSAGNPNELSRIPQPELNVLEYYRALKAYNTNWISYGWTANAAKYNPPRPKWADSIFEKNIEIYNVNFEATRAYMETQTNKSVRQDLFRRRIAPVPADPIPPEESNVTVNYATASTPLDDALNKEQDAADNNTNSIGDAQNTYNDLVPPGSSNYDPPELGDSYETVLIKLNKAFDQASANTSGSINAISEYTGSIPSSANRRLIGRMGRSFPVPRPILPATGLRENAAHFAPYKFNERQQYLIDYTPVDNANREILKANFCKSLGYLPADSAKADCVGGDCCAPLADMPRYTGSLQEGFYSASASESASPGQKQCIPSPIHLARRTMTISVPSAPLNVETSNRLYSYRMSKPIANCRPATSPEPITVGELYDAVRPAFMQEIKKSLEGDKMFSLRCPGSCFNN